MFLIKKILVIIVILFSCSCSENKLLKKKFRSDKVFIVKYFRNLIYNHYSPYFPIRGSYEIDSLSASTSKHYVFVTNKKGQLLKIVNHHFITGNIELHPLTHIQGVDSVIFTYNLKEEIRTFYGKSGRIVKNLKGVFKEVYKYDDENKLIELNFKDSIDQLMSSNWNISKYKWIRKNNLIVESRFDINGKASDLSPYFSFGMTGMQVNNDGLPVANYNLDQKFNVINNAMGVASYKDTYDLNFNQTSYAYYDKDSLLTNNPWGYAIGKLTYDALGNPFKEENFNKSIEMIGTIIFKLE